MAEENRCPQCGEKLAANAPGGVCPKCLIKLGLPSGADVEKTTTPDDKSGVPTSATPPGRFMPPEPAELAKQFPQLEILALLGQGGMGAVYKARQKQLDRLVALKILPPEVGQDPAFAERFTREARSMAKLSHQHVVTLHEFGQTEEGLYYFIMEFVDGTDLRHVIQSGELSPDEALVIVPKICEALHYAHKKGIVHRDIKPENILLDKEGNIKIADFGLARLLDRPGTAFTLTQAGQRMGTPHYMAPEQIEGAHEVDHRADIYSLGVVFYEMLTGQLPIGQFAPPSQKVQVDVRLDKVVLKSLAHEPERRYQQASEVKTDVETIAGQERVIARPLEHAGEEAIRHQVKLPAIGLLVTGIINWIGITAGVLFIVKSQAAQNNPIPEAALWLVAAIAIVFSGLIFFAALKMMRLEAYQWAIAGSILAMITTPGNIIGLPIGIWALVILTSDEVKGAFARKRKLAESKTGKPEGEPGQRRFSRPAIVGACLSALALFWMPAALIYVGEIHPSDLQEFIMWFCILIGCTPVFATTILGMVSITQIRHSAGRLYGMGLALFDVLLFPVLVLDIAIAVVFILAGLGVAEAVILMLIICGMLDFFLIRWAWRKANAGLEPAQIPTGEIPQSGVAVPTQPTEKPHQPERQASEIKTDVETISSSEQPPWQPSSPYPPYQTYLDRFFDFWTRPQPGLGKQVGIPILILLGVSMVALLSKGQGEVAAFARESRYVLYPAAFFLLLWTIRRSARREMARKAEQEHTSDMKPPNYLTPQADQQAIEVTKGTEKSAGGSELSTPAAVHVGPIGIHQQVKRIAIGLLIVGVVGLLSFAARQLSMTWMVNRTFSSTSPIWLLVQFLDLVGGLDLFKGLFLIAAALPMLWMRGYRLAVATSIVAMLPVGPSFLLGLPIGIWALSILSKPEVKTAFTRNKKVEESKISKPESKSAQRKLSRASIVEACCGPKSKTPSTSEDRISATGRFSRAAIAGACWAPLFLLLLVPVLMYIFVHQVPDTTGPATPKVGISLFGLIILVPCLLLGLSAPFGTTILGFISISQIRNSAGRLYGMGLALFDALLFPLLLLNVVIIFITASNIVQSPLGKAGQYVLLIAVLACPLLDLFIILWAWRKANAVLERPQGDQIAGTL